MVGFEHRKEGRRLRHESRDSPSFPTMYDGREALPDDHKFRGQRGRVRARYRRPQLDRGSEKIGETSLRKTTLQRASGAFSCKVAPFTPASERTKKAPSRVGRTGSNAQQHPVVIDCEVLQKRRSRCTTPGELRATRKQLSLPDPSCLSPVFRRFVPNPGVGNRATKAWRCSEASYTAVTGNGSSRSVESTELAGRIELQI